MMAPVDFVSSMRRGKSGSKVCCCCCICLRPFPQFPFFLLCCLVLGSSTFPASSLRSGAATGLSFMAKPKSVRFTSKPAVPGPEVRAFASPLLPCSCSPCQSSSLSSIVSLSLFKKRCGTAAAAAWRRVWCDDHDEKVLRTKLRRRGIAGLQLPEIRRSGGWE